MRRCLKKGDDYLGLKACKIMIGLLVRAGDDVAKDFPYRKVFSYLTDTLKSEKTSVKDVAIQITRSILQLGRSRSILFDESSECLYELVGIFKRTHEEPGVFQSGIVAVPQLQYGAGLCLWLLTFDRHVAAKLNKRYDLVPTMVEIARSAVKEKVIRVIVATWRNLIELAPQSNMPFLVDSKTTDCLYSIKARKLKDEDIKADVDALIERTEEQRSHMSTWDFYVSEVRSGRLSWTPAHRDESFWAMHAAKLDDDNHCVIRALHELLKNPPDTLSIAVACHDIGQYVHFNPAGKQ
ncbi:H(+)-transporting V1 sector ATPase subunit H [Spiromyces aspiralis]|uniref:H(+)-transporting V1 sector ATPase subunit H n=1 Tax=Spiromyces aspiralis TaxID=68401 RepID=A0ACC1H9X4_9FUNG|nr:H(+)-transporting V1 sector ATPase subunit H [Spiromyces aspiralis]